jgi:hypothetical protein
LIEGVHGIANAAAGFELADWKKDFAKYAPKISQTFVDSSAFDAAVLACLAGVHAGKSDGASISKSLRFVSGARGGTAYTYKELDKAVKDLAAGKAVSYTGPWGAVKFDAAGDSKAAVFDVYEVKGGKVVIDPKLQISYQK